LEISSGYVISFFIGTLSSLFGTWIYLRRRKKIKERIKELEFEQKFITKISSSSGEFVRFSHESILFVLFLICLANVIPLVTELLVSQQKMGLSSGILISIWGAAGMLALKDFSRSVKSKNLSNFKEKTDKKIQKLKSKLDD